MTKNGISIRSIIVSVILILVIIGMAVSYFMFTPKGVEGEKNITVVVTHKDSSEKEFNIKTEEQFLRGALESAELIGGLQSDYGMFLTIVDGEEVNTKNEEWWCVKKDGQNISYSVDAQPIRDGEEYEMIFMTEY